LAEKYEGFFDSTMDLQDIIGNSEETQKMNDDEWKEMDVKAVSAIRLNLLDD